MTHPNYRWQLTVEQVRDGRYPKNIDNFVYVLEWFLAMTARAHGEGHISDDTVNILSNEIAGALAGKNADQRQGQRFVDALLRIYG